MKIATMILLLVNTVFAKDEFRYFSEWKALYSHNGSNIITKLPHKAGMKIPSSHCHISDEAQIQSNRFQRSIICPDRKVLVDCSGKPRTWEKEMIVKCEESLGNGDSEIILIGRVKTFYTRKRLRELQREEEKKNTIPY